MWNLLLDEENILSNRELHIGYNGEAENMEDLSERDITIMEILRNNPNITLQEVADKISKSLRTVKIAVKSLQERGLVERVGEKKNGTWKIV